MSNAGWYADPSGRQLRRYFDGQQWTEHYAPESAAVVLPRHTGALGGVVVVTVLFAFMLYANAGVGGAIAALVVGAGVGWAFHHDLTRERRQDKASHDWQLSGDADIQNHEWIYDNPHGAHGHYPPAV